MGFVRYNGKNVEIGRYIGGFAWHGEKPGFGVVVAETLYPPETNSHDLHYYVIEEFEDYDMNNLITRCANAASVNPVLRFCGRYDRMHNEYIFTWNRNFRKPGAPEFELHSAPNSQNGLIENYINMLQFYLGKKRLHLSREGSRLRGYLQEVQDTDVVSATDAQFPAVAALGYAVTTLIQFPPENEEPEYEPIPQKDSSAGWY